MYKMAKSMFNSLIWRINWQISSPSHWRNDHSSSLVKNWILLLHLVKVYGQANSSVQRMVETSFWKPFQTEIVIFQILMRKFISFLNRYDYSQIITCLWKLLYLCCFFGINISKIIDDYFFILFFKKGSFSLVLSGGLVYFL